MPAGCREAPKVCTCGADANRPGFRSRIAPRMTSCIATGIRALRRTIPRQGRAERLGGLG